MASCPSLHGKYKGEKWKQWQILFSLASQSLWTVTAAMKLKHACSLRKKSYDKARKCIKKQSHYFADKGPYSQGYGFYPVVMYRWKSWSMKKAEYERTGAFELWCWRRLLTVPWIARSNQGILKRSTLNIYWKDWCWSWSSNTLATWWEETTHWKIPWCWKRLKAKGEENSKGWDVQDVKSITDSMDLYLSKLQRQGRTGKSGMLQSMESQGTGHDLETEQQHGFHIPC